ncbi:MAG: hypothetical protein JWN13_4213 [Betaproteobacteria bacterium]|nr:hypothetical protein [Betaproteobacteria bacterium]MEA3155329.1 hypothetical protein [Betaproteobacteria bacterium]
METSAFSTGTTCHGGAPDAGFMDVMRGASHGGGSSTVSGTLTLRRSTLTRIPTYRPWSSRHRPPLCRRHPPYLQLSLATGTTVTPRARITRTSRSVLRGGGLYRRLRRPADREVC